MSNSFKVLSDFEFCLKLLCKHLTLLCNALTWSNPWIQNRASDICLMTFFHSVLLASKWLRCYHNGHGMYLSRSTLQALCEERNKRYLNKWLLSSKKLYTLTQIDINPNKGVFTAASGWLSYFIYYDIELHLMVGHDYWNCILPHG